MTKSLLLLIVVVGCCFRGNATGDAPLKKFEPFVSVQYGFAHVFPTNSFVEGSYPGGKSVDVSQSYAIQLGRQYRPDTWQYHKYGRSYEGVGIRFATFGDPKYLGNPLSLYYFEGGNLFTFSDRLRLKYEVNLGLALGWKRYDPAHGYWNDATGGSPASAMVDLNLLLAYHLSDYVEVEFGGGLSHYSNGAFQLPNMGLNQAPIKVAMKYYMQPSERVKPNRSLPAPMFNRSMEWDVSGYITKRQRFISDAPILGELDNINQFDNINYLVANLNVAAMFRSSYLFRWGFAAEAMYDESCGVEFWLDNSKTRILHQLAPVANRINIGVGMKAEIILPGFSFFSQIGYNVLHQSIDCEQFYQSIGATCRLSDSLHLIGGVRASSFRVAQCMFVGLSYSFRRVV